MTENITLTNMGYAGLVYVPIKKMQDTGKKLKDAEERRVQKALEEARKKVSPIYNSREKIIEYYKGRHLDTFA